MITDSNNNFMLNLMASAFNNPLTLQTNQQQPILNSSLPSAFMLNNTESFLSAWNQQQQLINQKEYFSTVPNVSFLQGMTPLNLSSTNMFVEYETALKMLQLQLLLQQQQQRQALAEKQLLNMESLLKLLTSVQDNGKTMKNFHQSNNSLFGVKKIVEHEFSLKEIQQEKVPQFPMALDMDFTVNQSNFILPQYAENNKLGGSSAACSSTSTSRDSTPPQLLLHHGHESLTHLKFQSELNNAEKEQQIEPLTTFVVVDDDPHQHDSDAASVKPTARKRSHDDCESLRPSFLDASSSANSAEVNLAPSKKKAKSLRKRLQRQDNVTNSPVSGMFIKENCTADDLQRAAELDDTASYVHISDEARNNIAAIPDVIGDSICALCKVKYEDVFRLAMHRCPRIVHEEYRCPECDKMFSCPANLASHRRWHRPRNDDVNEGASSGSQDTLAAGDRPFRLTCIACGDTFTARKMLRAHKKSCTANAKTHTADAKPTVSKLISVDETTHFDAADACQPSPTVAGRSLEKISAAAAALVSLGAPQCVRVSSAQ